MSFKWAYFPMFISIIGAAQAPAQWCEFQTIVKEGIPSSAAQRSLKMPPSNIARQVLIENNQKQMIAWMRDDLENYLANFDAIFDAKLQRIQRHEAQRRADLEKHTAPVRTLLEQKPNDTKLQSELERLIEIHKPQGFIEEYTDSKDFAAKYIGPRHKLLKSNPTEAENRLMDIPGKKLLYVDTWAVPFFNAGTQSRAQAKEGVRQALEVFSNIDLGSNISLLRFTELMALFARPEFDDIRRYKLLPFPNEEDVRRFGLERSDAKTFGEKYPEENFVFLNQAVGLDTVSFIFGQRLSIFGLISHSVKDNTADGRIFTGPADFLEHDYAHAFFNLTPAIPGSAAEWEKVHHKFIAMWTAETDPKKKRMMMLVYYHFTHESGFQVLKPNPDGRINLDAFRNEINIIDELLHTRYHYDFILNGSLFADGYKSYLQNAFTVVGEFFKKSFLKILAAERARMKQPALVFAEDK